MSSQIEDIPLSRYRPKPMLVTPEHIPERARFPVVDAHNHLMGDPPAEEMISVMNKAGVRVFVNLTGNTVMSFEEKGYTIRRRDIGFFIENYMKKHPGRFACFTMSDFANLQDEVLIRDVDFAEHAAACLEEDVKKGACGLKVTKELGLRFKDSRGAQIPVDDPRLDKIWEAAARLKVPVLIHTGDPEAFFLPINEENEHFPTLRQAPDWSFYGARFSKKELLEQRNRMIARHPRTTFICAHVGNYPESLAYVSKFLDTHPNTLVDISARIDELGRQPYSARDFMIRYQDRVLFGIDMPVRAEVYRAYFRFFETRDEYFEYPDYVGRFGHCRWRIHGLHLPDKVLKKIYYKNACRVIPGIHA